MDDATSVEPRTKEPFSMDDHSSVTSNSTYQATFDERSEVDSSVSTPRDTPDARKRQGFLFDGQTSEQTREIGTSERQHKSIEISDSVKESVNLMSTPKTNDRGRSKSPRPVVSAATRARWAMLKSLAGVAQGDEESETKIDEKIAREYHTDLEVSGMANQLDNNPATSPDSRLRPLHLGEDAGHDASVERYLQKLEQNPLIDHHRGFQEGLQVARTLSKRSKSRQRDGDMSNENGPERKMPYGTRQTDQEIRSNGSRRSFEGDLAFRGDIAEDGRNIEQRVRTEGQYMQQTAQEAKRTLQGVFHGENSGYEGEHRGESEIEHATNGMKGRLPTMNLRGDLRNGERAVKDGINGIGRGLESEISRQDVRQNVRRAEHDLQEGQQKLGPERVVQDVRRGERDVHAGFKDAETSIDRMLPSVRIGRDLQSDERGLQDGLHRLEGEHTFQDVGKGEQKFDAEVIGAKKAVEEMLPNLHVGQEVRRGEHDLVQDFRIGENKLRSNLGGAERIVEDVLPDLHLGRDIRAGEHELEKGLRSVGGHGLVRDIVNGEHDLKSGFQVAENAVEAVLPDLGVVRDVQKGEHELKNGIQEGADLAKREMEKLTRADMATKLDRTGHAIQHDVASLGGSATSNLLRDQQSIERKVGVVERDAEGSVLAAHRSIQNGLHQGDRAVNGEIRVAAQEQSRTQDHEHAKSRSSNRMPNTIQSVRGQSNPMASNAPLNKRQSVAPHHPSPNQQAQKPEERRSEQAGGRAPQAHVEPSQNSRPPVIAAQHGQSHMPFNAKQLRPSLLPAQPRALSSAASGASKSPMPMALHVDQGPDQKTQTHGQGVTASNLHRPGTEDVDHRPIQPPARVTGVKSASDQQNREQGLESKQRSVPPAQKSANLRPGPAPRRLSRHIVKDAACKDEDHPANKCPHQANSISRTQPQLPSACKHENHAANQCSHMNQRLPGSQTQNVEVCRHENHSAGHCPHKDQSRVAIGGQQALACKHENHPAKQCPQIYHGLPGSQTQDVAVCKHEGHPADQCPHQNQNRLLSSQQTPPCRHVGHPANQCPRSNQVLEVDRPGAPICRHEGHKSNQCPHNVQSHITATAQQAVACRHVGHPASECPQRLGKIESKTRGPPVCKHEGHQAEECPQQSRAGPKRQLAVTEPPCRHNGHESHACPQQANHSAINIQQAAIEQPTMVSGPQHMLNMFKASTQASLDASSGCPGFRDQMMQVFFSIAQDAMPEVERRLGQNWT